MTGTPHRFLKDVFGSLVMPTVWVVFAKIMAIVGPTTFEQAMLFMVLIALGSIQYEMRIYNRATVNGTP